MANHAKSVTFFRGNTTTKERRKQAMSLRFTLMVLLALTALAAELTVTNDNPFEHPRMQPQIEAGNDFEHPWFQRSVDA